MSPKICTKCKKPKDPQKDFHKSRRNKDGLAPRCKMCVGEYHKDWYNGNTVKRQQNKTYYQENPERFREWALQKKI